ncbi:MAG TPA: MbcA/ParS/Xre antitoxin family protein [Acidobacteriaceae bacterium]|nr:MbcA/ParS/Xre antitoxin family protein [Acidobacteriaceae bacterium]
MATAYAIPNIAGYPFNILPDLSNPIVRARLSPSAIRGFARIMEHWGVKEVGARKLLGGPSAGTYYGWKAHPQAKKLDQDTLTRISLVIGIYKALHILYSDKLADAWVTLPNRDPMFRGETPLAYMVEQGQPGMIHVRQLLDAWRGGQ